jgi:type II secretory pathway component PulF
MTQNATTEYPTTGSIVALIGGIIITLSGALFAAVSAFVLPHIDYSNLNTPANLPASAVPGLVSGFVGLMGVFGLVTGAIVLFSAVMLLTNTGNRRTWSVLVLVFSVLSFIGLGGFVVGAALGIVGGALVLRWKPSGQ